MSRVVNGMHMPNLGYAYDVEQMLRIAHPTGAVTILDFMMFEQSALSNEVHGDNENEYWYGKLRYGWGPQGIAAAPERLIHVRAYMAKWRDWEPEEVARRVVPQYSNWKSAGRDGHSVLHANLWADPYVTISPCNEQNLEGDWTDWWKLDHVARSYILETEAAWQLRFWDEVDRLVPDRKATSCLGALAYGGDWIADVPDSEYQHPRWQELCNRVDIIATHPYAHLDRADGWATVDPTRDGYWHLLRDFRPEGWRDEVQPGRPHDVGGILAQFPSKPLLISESGTFVHGDTGKTQDTAYAMRTLLDTAAESGRCLGVTWFVWHSGAEHAGNRIWPNKALRGAMESMPAYTTTATVPFRGGQDGTVTLGCDVSHWQGNMDWRKAKANGVRFAFIKVTEGSSFTDPRWRQYADDAKREGILVGPYHYYRNRVAPDVQLAHFLRVCEAYEWTLPPVVDCEDTADAANGDHIRSYCEALHEKWNAASRPFIYTATWWWHDGRFGGPQHWAEKYPLWVADYSGYVSVPSDWAGVGYVVHQFTSSAPGESYGASSESIDLNKTTLTIQQLAAMGVRGGGSDPGFNLDGLKRWAKIWHETDGIRVNPDAALFKAVLADGLNAVTNEAQYGPEQIPFIVAESYEEVGAWVYWWYKGKIGKDKLNLM